MIVNICGMDLYWESEGQGFPLVCIHGYGVDHRSIKFGMESVCTGTKGFQRIYLDLPGMGQSETHPGILSSDDMLEVVCQFIDRVVGPDQPFAVAGYSYGGYLARGVLYQMAEQVRGMLLLCPVINFTRTRRVLPEFRCCEQDREFIKGLPPEAFSQMDGFITIQTREVWEAYLTHVHPSLALADPGLMARIRDTEFSFPMDNCDLPCEIPILVLAGRYDVSVGYEDAKRLAKAYPNASFILFDQAGHLLHIEQHGLFCSHVRDWLEQFQGKKKAGSN